MQKGNSTVWNPWHRSQFWRLLVRHKQLNNLNAIHCCCQDYCSGLTTASSMCSFCIRDCPFQVTVTVGTRRNVYSATSLQECSVPPRANINRVVYSVKKEAVWLEIQRMVGKQHCPEIDGTVCDTKNVLLYRQFYLTIIQ